MCGCDHLRVASVPSVELLTLGNEILSTGVPTAGMVRDAFRPQLPTIVAGLGGRMGAIRHVGDTLAATMDALSASIADVTVTTGGSAHGHTDHMRAALTALGAVLLIDGVRMRPGRPLILATLPGGKIVLALPGNPLAAIIGVLSIGEPLLAGLLGQSLTDLGTVRLGVHIEVPGTHTALVPYLFDDGVAVPTRWQGSAMMRGLADATGICIIPPGGTAAGDITRTLRLPWMTD
jgi:molybdopterin molybdotransferase